MGRTLFLEKYLEDKIDQFLNANQGKPVIGLILGQQTEPKDFAVHLVKCPDPVDDEAEIEITEEEDTVVVKKGKTAANKKEKVHTTAADVIDVKWISEHGRQVNRMMTGGISVLGIFVHSTTEMISKNQAKFSQCLFSLQTKIDKNKWLRKSSVHTDRYLLHMCSLTRKITCRTLNLAEQHQAILKPAEFRFQPFISSWHSVNTTVDMHINICVPISKKASDTESAILQACQGEIEQIWNSYTTEGFKLVKEDQLISQPSGAKSKIKHEVGKNIKLTLFKTPFSKNVEDIINYEPTNLEVKFFGAIQSRAILHTKATYGDAVKALKVDIIRSLLTRIELLCEEAEVNNLDDAAEWNLVSPTRVFFPFSYSELYFCDYSFKDEASQDIISRFKELLDVNPTPPELVFSERFPDVSEASMLFHSPEKAADQQSDIASEISNSLLEEPKNKRFIFFLISLLVVLIGIGLHLVFK